MLSHEEVRVLIAEDDFMVSEAIRGSLEQLPFTVVGCAVDGHQAVKMTGSERPDVVLMDIRMPDMDGLEATQQIQLTCPTPVVILTAFDTMNLVTQAGQAGAGAYLVKMPDPPEIERAVAIAIARFDDMMALRRLNIELQAALDKVKLLSGMLPICSNCKKIRDDDGYWQDVAAYIRDHSEAEFTHSICPNCISQLYPDFYKE
jgi:AmiR/NasT family two-component response regulator